MKSLFIFATNGHRVGIRRSDGLVAAVRNGPSSDLLLSRFLDAAPSMTTGVPLEFPSSTFGSSSGSLLVSQVCNLRCVYCFAGDGDYGSPRFMDWENAKASIDALLSAPADEGAVHINFFGGEPLLAWNLIERCVQYAELEADRRVRDVSFSMTTNATRVTQPIADFLHEHAFHILVSIDGTREEHDASRPDARGRGSWNATALGAKILLATLGPDHVTARATLRAGHAQYADIERSLSQLGFQEMHLCLEGIHATQHDEHGVRGSDWERLIQKAEEMAEAYTPEQLVGNGASGQYDPIADTITLLLDGQALPMPCGVGGSAITTAADGTVYPCHRFAGDSTFALGDVAGEEGRARGWKKLRDLFHEVIADCDGCPAKRFCAGGCIHESSERIRRGLSPHDDDECRSIVGTTMAAITAVARHLDHELLATPRVVDRTALDARCRIARFELTQRQVTRQYRTPSPRA